MRENVPYDACASVLLCVTIGRERKKMSKTISIRLNDAEAAAFEAQAKFEGKPLSAAMKDALWEKVEDWHDTRVAEREAKYIAKNPESLRPIKELREELLGY
jgi:predicted DNA-binding protein